jgi:hypothetical protein
VGCGGASCVAHPLRVILQQVFWGDPKHIRHTLDTLPTARRAVPPLPEKVSFRPLGVRVICCSHVQIPNSAPFACTFSRMCPPHTPTSTPNNSQTGASGVRGYTREPLLCALRPSAARCAGIRRFVRAAGRRRPQGRMEQVEQMEQMFPKNPPNARLKGLFRNYRSICSNRSTTTRAKLFRCAPTRDSCQSRPPIAVYRVL